MRLQAGQVIGRAPLAEELHVQDCAGELLGEDRQDVVHAGGGRRADGLEAVLVGGLAVSWVNRWSCRTRSGGSMSSESSVATPVRSRTLSRSALISNSSRGSRASTFDSLSLGLLGQFCDDAGSGHAEVEHRKAARRVEPPTESPCSVAASGIEAFRLVPVGDGREGGPGELAERPGVERRHVRRSRPPPTLGGGRSPAGSDRRR